METTTTRSAPADARPFGGEEADASLKGTRRWALALTVLAAANAVLCAGLIAVIVWMVTRRMTLRCAEVTNAVLNSPLHT